MEKGYCVKCKAKREIGDAKKVTMKNKRQALLLDDRLPNGDNT